MTLRTRWLLGGAVAAALILAVGYLLLIRPAQDSVNEARTAAAEQYAANEQAAADLAVAQQQAAEVPAKMAEIEQVKTKLPSSMGQSDLVRSVQNTATTAGVDLKRISAQTPAKVEGSPGDTQLVDLPYQLTATGTYESLKAFVSGLERLPRAFLITDLYIGSPGQQFGELTLNLTGSFYSLSNYEVAPPQNVPTTAAGAAKRPKGKQARTEAEQQRRAER